MSKIKSKLLVSVCLTICLVAGGVAGFFARDYHEGALAKAKRVAILGGTMTTVVPITDSADIWVFRGIVAAHRSEVSIPQENDTWAMPCFQILEPLSDGTWSNLGHTIGIRKVASNPDQFQVCLKDALNTLYPLTGAPSTFGGAWGQIADELRREADDPFGVQTAAVGKRPRG